MEKWGVICMINVYEYHTIPNILFIPDFGDNAKLTSDYISNYFHRTRMVVPKSLELIISKSPQYSLTYAMNELGYKRFKLGEPAIATNAHAAYTYAAFVLKGRFKEAEDTIAQDAQYSCRYAMDVIKGRWTKGEDNLLHGNGYNHEQELYMYIRDVVKGRWIEAEPRIKAGDWKELYEQLFKIKL